MEKNEKWISLKDQLPPYGEWISVLDVEYNAEGTGLWMEGSWILKQDYQSHSKPTHWKLIKKKWLEE